MLAFPSFLRLAKIPCVSGPHCIYPRTDASAAVRSAALNGATPRRGPARAVSVLVVLPFSQSALETTDWVGRPANRGQGSGRGGEDETLGLLAKSAGLNGLGREVYQRAHHPDFEQNR